MVPLRVLISSTLPPTSWNPTTTTSVPIAIGRCLICARGIRITQSRTIQAPDGTRMNSMRPPARGATTSCGSRTYVKSR